MDTTTDHFTPLALRVRGNEKLKEFRDWKETLKIRRDNKKTENHKKQHLATLKRLKRGDDNELERNLRLEKVVVSEQLRLAMETDEEKNQDWRRR